MALPVGARIARYRVLAVLGQGGFGITYRAVDESLDREVAIKEYLPTALAVRQDGITVLPRSTKVADDFGWGRDRFISEGRTLASLHEAPGIVRVFDFMELNGTAYIVMELVRGDTLEARLKQGALTPGEIDRVLATLLDGLEQVHAAGFLHRDIKPANILLRPDGRPTLIDFGASRAAMAGRTAAMTAIFTPGYAAPEQFTAARQGPWTDIYGLSATLYHAITGAPPPSAFDRMLEETCQPVARIAPPGFAPALLVGIDAGLAVRASDRPQTVAGWRALLQGAGAAGDATVRVGTTLDPGATTVLAPPAPSSPAPAPAPSPAPPAPAAPARARRRAGLLGAAAAAALLLLGGGYALMRSEPPPPRAVAVPDKREDDAAKAMEAQRRAEVEAAEKRRLEEAAQREQAAQELARLRDELEAQRKAAAEAKAEAEAEAETKAKADAEARDRQEADARKTSEAAEAALRLTSVDRQRLQVALTALGFDTHGSDGAFGPRTRQMIAAWQGRRGDPATGFLSATQEQALLRDAAPAVGKFDDALKKAEEEAKAAAAAKATPPPPARSAPATAPPPAASAPSPAVGRNPYDGRWTGTAALGNGKTQPLNVTLENGIGGGRWHNRRCGSDTIFTVTVQPDGRFVVEFQGHTAECDATSNRVSGTVQNNLLTFHFQRGAATFTLRR